MSSGTGSLLAVATNKRKATMDRRDRRPDFMVLVS